MDTIKSGRRSHRLAEKMADKKRYALLAALYVAVTALLNSCHHTPKNTDPIMEQIKSESMVQ